MKDKRRKKLKERESRRAKLRKRLESRRVLSGPEFSLRREVDYMVECAVAGALGRCVSVGPFVLFATTTGDAWLLDPSDDLSLCLCRDYQPQPVNILENDGRCLISWDKTFTIEGDLFTFLDKNTGSIRTIMGYPTQEILAAIARTVPGPS